MSIIQIIDIVGIAANLQIRDDSPLAKAKLTQLLSTSKSLIGEFTKPVDQTDIGTVSLGAQLATPSSLIDGVTDLMVNGGVNCDLTVLTPVDKFLFPVDGFAPTIPIAANQSWIGFELDVTLGAKLSGAIDGFGVAVQAGAKLGLTTYVLLAGTPPPLPLLKDAIGSAFDHFSVSVTAQGLRQQPSGTVNVSDLSGTVSVTGSYSFPLSIGAFACANLPFNFSVNIAPTATAKVAGCVAVSGDFLVRSHKVSDTLLHFGVYKKKGSTLSASLIASAGIEIAHGDTDLLGAVLNAALPTVDVTNTGIPGDTAKALDGVIKASLDRSIAIELNAKCTAATTHEAAVLYEIHLDQGNATKTDLALQSALRGDWTLLNSLENATSLRNIIVETNERKQTLSLNLLGFYNANSVADYVSKCTILRDETGQLTIVDCENASRIAATATPYTADPDKLRTALAQDFITTASYAAIGPKFSLNLTVVQDYLDYADKMSSQQLRGDVLLGNAIGVIPAGTFTEDLAANRVFPHARVKLSLRYDNAAVMSIFFSDPASRTARTPNELESVGRSVMVTLLDPLSDAAVIAVLNNDAAWAAMDEGGNVSGFGFIPELKQLSVNDLATVSAHWVDIRWWSKTISKVAPQLASTLAALDNAAVADPAADPVFMKQRANLAAILEAVSRDTHAAFVNTWGPAVIYALSGRRGAIQMDVAWDNNSRHFERGPL